MDPEIHLDAEKFSYSPLDTLSGYIRVVQLLKELSTEGLIQCTIKHVRMSDHPYRCLSYVWGSGSEHVPILMDGKIFYVRLNLHQFLATFRSAWAGLNLWIDALCINQSNVLE